MKVLLVGFLNIFLAGSVVADGGRCTGSVASCSSLWSSRSCERNCESVINDCEDDGCWDSKVSTGSLSAPVCRCKLTASGFGGTVTCERTSLSAACSDMENESDCNNLLSCRWIPDPPTPSPTRRPSPPPPTQPTPGGPPTSATPNEPTSSSQTSDSSGIMTKWQLLMPLSLLLVTSFLHLY